MAHPETHHVLRAWLASEDPRELAMDGAYCHALAVHFADPADHAYPIDPRHLHAAISYFGKYAHRYPPELRKKMAKRILRAAVRHHIEVAPTSAVSEIARGESREPAGHERPGPHREAMAGAEVNSNGPAGPAPFPANPGAAAADAQRERLPAFVQDIEHLTKWTKEGEGTGLALVLELMDALDQSGMPR